MGNTATTSTAALKAEANTIRAERFALDDDYTAALRKDPSGKAAVFATMNRRRIELTVRDEQVDRLLPIIAEEERKAAKQRRAEHVQAMVVMLNELTTKSEAATATALRERTIEAVTAAMVLGW